MSEVVMNEDITIRSSSLEMSGHMVAHLDVQGCVDSHTSEDLDKTINRILSNGTYHFAIRLSSVKYMSCAGMSVLLHVMKHVYEHNGALVLISPSVEVLEILELLGLAQVFVVAEDLDSAMSQMFGSNG